MPTLQHTLNNTASATLGGYAPITVMTGLSAESPADLCIQQPTFASNRPSAETIAAKTTDAAAALRQMHKVVHKAQSVKRAISRRSRSRRSFPDFIESDFVLVAKSDNQIPSKSSARWSGPTVVVAIPNKWIYVVRVIKRGTRH